MRPANSVRDSDVARLSDEELVRLVREADSHSALGTLVERHYVRLRRLVRGWARKEQLQEKDRQDLGQEAYLFLLKAVHKYRTGEDEPIRSTRFRTYLGLMIYYWFRDAVRRLRRQERHIDRTVQAEDLLRNKFGPLATTDPAAIALRRDLWEGLDSAVFNLDEPLRRLCNELELGHSLHASAAALGWSYDRTKRMRRRMRAQLKDWLKEEAD